MSRLISAPFFSAHPVFRHPEYAAAVGRRPDDKVVTAMLTQHLRAGNIQSVPDGAAACPGTHDARTDVLRERFGAVIDVTVPADWYPRACSHSVGSRVRKTVGGWCRSGIEPESEAYE